jgi:hypothetical protein
MARAVVDENGPDVRGLRVERFFGPQRLALLSCPETRLAWLDACVWLDEDCLQVECGDPDATAWGTTGRVN